MIKRWRLQSILKASMKLGAISKMAKAFAFTYSHGI
jgi:hypothetical protein